MRKIFVIIAVLSVFMWLVSCSESKKVEIDDQVVNDNSTVDDSTTQTDDEETTEEEIVQDNSVVPDNNIEPDNNVENDDNVIPDETVIPDDEQPTPLKLTKMKLLTEKRSLMMTQINRNRHHAPKTLSGSQ